MKLEGDNKKVSNSIACNDLSFKIIWGLWSSEEVTPKTRVTQKVTKKNNFFI